MGKWKTKLASKFSSKENNSHKEEKQKNDYFHNVVPPITTSNVESSTNKSNLNNTNVNSTNNNFQKINNLNDLQVSSSFVIPLNENLRPALNQIDSNLNQNFFVQQEQKINEKQIDTMALINFKENFKIPRALSYEIRIEKLKQLIMSLLSLIVMTISSIFIAFYFSDWNFPYIPHAVITIPLLIFSFMILAVNFLDFISLKKEVNLYIEKTIKGSLMPPNFIIRNYRKIHGRLIIFNWFFTFCYITLGLAALFMYLLSGQKLTFLVQSWTFTVPDLMADVVTLLIVLGVIFFIHTMNFISFKKRKNNIISYYGYEVVSPSDLEIYKKKINRICMIITLSFLIIIFFAIAIPILVLRRKKRKLKL